MEEQNQIEQSIVAKKHPVVLVILLVVFALVSIGILMYTRSQKKAVMDSPLNRQDELQKLTETSKPITTTLEDRGEELDKLEQVSARSDISTEERIKELKKLSR